MWFHIKLNTLLLTVFIWQMCDVDRSGFYFKWQPFKFAEFKRYGWIIFQFRITDKTIQIAILSMVCHFQSWHLQITRVSNLLVDCPLTKGEWRGKMDVKKLKKSVHTTWTRQVAGLHALRGKTVRVKGATASSPHSASYMESNPALTVGCWEVSSIHSISSDKKPLPELKKNKQETRMQFLLYASGWQPGESVISVD